MSKMIHNPFPRPLEDIISDTGLHIPTLRVIVDELGFDYENSDLKVRSRFLRAKERTTIFKHKTQDDITMVMYHLKDEVEFFKGDKPIYIAKSRYHCYVNSKKIIREINFSILI